MANLITGIRLGLLFLLVSMIYQLPSYWQLLDAPLLILIFALDGLDGYVARKRGEESLFGAVFDIAVDRIVENVLWIVLVNLGLVSVWVAIVFITRSFLVDSIRNQGAKEGQSPFSMLSTGLGRWLVGSRFMRLTYAIAKMAVFAWLLLIPPWRTFYPTLSDAGPIIDIISAVLIYLAVTMCIVRGLPVIVEFARREKLAWRADSPRETPK